MTAISFGGLHSLSEHAADFQVLVSWSVEQRYCMVSVRICCVCVSQYLLCFKTTVSR